MNFRFTRVLRLNWAVFSGASNSFDLFFPGCCFLNGQRVDNENRNSYTYNLPSYTYLTLSMRSRDSCIVEKKNSSSSASTLRFRTISIISSRLLTHISFSSLGFFLNEFLCKSLGHEFLKWDLFFIFGAFSASSSFSCLLIFSHHRVINCFLRAS